MFFPNKGSPDPVKHITVFNSELLFKCLTELATSSAEGYRKELREYQALFLKKEGLIQCGGGGELWEEFELVSASQGKKKEERDMKFHCSLPLIREESSQLLKRSSCWPTSHSALGLASPFSPSPVSSIAVVDPRYLCVTYFLFISASVY